MIVVVPLRYTSDKSKLSPVRLIPDDQHAGHELP